MDKYVCVVDSSVAIKLIIDKITNAKCSDRGDDLVCEIDNKTFKLSKNLFRKIKESIEKYGGKIIKEGNKYEFYISPKWKEGIKMIKEKIKDTCKDVLFTPDLTVEGITKDGLYIGKSPLHMSIKPEKQSLWNYALKETLDEFNAKILLDNDIKNFFEGTVGTEIYNRLYGIWVNTVGKDHIDTDKANRVEPIITFSINNNKIIVTKDTIVVNNRELKVDQPALESAKKVFEITYRFLNESKEATKRISISKDTIKIYHGKEGSIDAYLRAIARADNVKVFTSDKDIVLPIRITDAYKPKNIEYIPI